MKLYESKHIPVGSKVRLIASDPEDAKFMNIGNIGVVIDNYGIPKIKWKKNKKISLAWEHQLEIIKELIK
jgi:hypothetical protein